ncbi:MAG: GNAT family N-acetyltransferase, partial [Saprospiraceae bacterium]
GESEERLFQNVKKNYRNKIRTAKAKLHVSSDMPLRHLHRMSQMTFERKGMAWPVPYATLERVWAALSKHGCGRLFFATDRISGELHAACLLAWDAHSAHLLMSGSDPSLRQSGAGVLLQWEAILYAKNALNLSVFDFEGSMLPEVERVRRDFGAKQRPYFRVRKEWSQWWKWGKVVRELSR